MLSFDPGDDAATWPNSPSSWPIPSVSRDAEPRRRCAPPRTGWPASSRSPAAGSSRDRRPSGGPRRVAGRPGRADHPGLRALRRAAHRRPRPSGSRPPFELTVDGDVARGRGRHRRQGPGLHRAEDRPGVPGPGGRPAAQREVPVRGRGGDRQPAPGRLRHARTPASSRPTWSSPPTARCGGRASRRCRWRPRAWSSMDIVVEGAARDLHSGPVRRHRRQPAARAGRDPGQPARPRTARSPWPASTTASPS